MIRAFFKSGLILSFLLVCQSLQAAAKVKTSEQTTRQFESQVGFGYEYFEDSVKVSNAVGTEEGFANFAGFNLHYTGTWWTNKWYFPLGLGFGWGRASAGDFPTIAVPQRLWSQPYASVSSLYRLSSHFAVGPGLMVYSRSINWTSDSDPNVSSESKSKMGYGPELDLRLDITPELSVLQTVSVLEFKHHTQWQWTLQYRL